MTGINKGHLDSELSLTFSRAMMVWKDPPAGMSDVLLGNQLSAEFVVLVVSILSSTPEQRSNQVFLGCLL